MTCHREITARAILARARRREITPVRVGISRPEARNFFLSSFFLGTRRDSTTDHDQESQKKSKTRSVPIRRATLRRTSRRPRSRPHARDAHAYTHDTQRVSRTHFAHSAPRRRTTRARATRPNDLGERDLNFLNSHRQSRVRDCEVL